MSVTPVAIAGVKSTLSEIHSERARVLAQRAVNASDPSEVEKMFRAMPQEQPAPAERRGPRVEKEEPVG